MRSALQIVIFVTAVAAAGCAHTYTVQTNPPGANVYVSGHLKGQSPITIEEERGVNKSSRVRIEKDGYEPVNARISQGLFGIRANDMYTYDLTPAESESAGELSLEPEPNQTTRPVRSSTPAKKPRMR